MTQTVKTVSLKAFITLMKKIHKEIAEQSSKEVADKTVILMSSDEEGNSYNTIIPDSICFGYEPNCTIDGLKTQGALVLMPYNEDINVDF